MQIQTYFYCLQENTLNLKFSICCWNVVQAAIDPVEIDVRPESVTVSHDLVRADHVTILYFQINLPVTGRCLLFQFDKRRFAFIVKVRLWVKVVDLHPSFQISQSNIVWTFVQKQHHCVINYSNVFVVHKKY